MSSSKPGTKTVRMVLPSDELQGNSGVYSGWFLTGQLFTGGPMQLVPINSSPFRIGRRRDLALCLTSRSVSGLHAEINIRDGRLYLRDLGSMNGTFVNGQALLGELPVETGDLLQFADITVRVCYQPTCGGSVTAIENFCDQAIALSRFDDLLTDRAVVAFLQPIVSMGDVNLPEVNLADFSLAGASAADGGMADESIADVRPVAFELLGRGRLFGLKTPREMFLAASRLNRERELSVLLRAEGLSSAQVIPAGMRMFVNTHPVELQDPQQLVVSLADVRRRNHTRPITVEIHEAAVVKSPVMRELRTALCDLDMELAYDDFGAGQARIAEMAAFPPHVLKFDMALIRGIHSAGPNRQRLLENLVRMAQDIGIRTLAEGVECSAEAQVCRQVGFELAQGFLFGKPSRPSQCLSLIAFDPTADN